VFLLCGLWHGADFTFVIWGLWHGLFLSLERVKALKPLGRAPRPVARLYCMLVVLVGWVFFRADRAGTAWIYLKSVFSPDLSPSLLTSLTPACLALAAGALFCLAPDRLFPAPRSVRPEAFPAALYWLQAALAVLSVSLLLGGARNPFIYFNF
jgi:alginate O-acetyltransferase complex protein AlgI